MERFLENHEGTSQPGQPKMERHMGVSKNRDTPKWMVYMENPIKMDDLGVPLFSETSICVSNIKVQGVLRCFFVGCCREGLWLFYVIGCFFLLAPNLFLVKLIPIGFALNMSFQMGGKQIVKHDICNLFLTLCAGDFLFVPDVCCLCWFGILASKDVLKRVVSGDQNPCFSCCMQGIFATQWSLWTNQ